MAGRVIGTLPCRGLDCGEKVAVTETGGGSLSLKCNFCGFSPYAPPGSKAARKIRAAMVSIEDPDQDPAPAPRTDPPKAPGKPPAAAKPPAAPKPPPPPAAPRSPFALEQLT